ncbi:putative eukaryotic translation initiation factor 4 gamma 3 [Trichinella spiralis]|uniref:putative eukaryotic translation initiation factor 4 gamma 3 n=1 Tax=Trichinella spiralis TaxID=6334 RepID=UPI0001EFD81C|nr:putative eukaryotic translation initiation factor 4 gamma 3 [Trichinella spiralis]
MLIKRCFPWRRPLTSLGPPEDAVVCACHRCAGCTRTKSTRTELLNLCQSQFGAIRRMYHELREKDAVLQNVDDPNMRAELEREFEEQSASTKRHTIGVMRLIGKLFVWKMITLTILCEGFMNRVLYVVTRYCFTWWTCGHAAHASSVSQLKFIILELIISTARSRMVL